MEYNLADDMFAALGHQMPASKSRKLSTNTCATSFPGASHSSSHTALDCDSLGSNNTELKGAIGWFSAHAQEGG